MDRMMNASDSFLLAPLKVTQYLFEVFGTFLFGLGAGITTMIVLVIRLAYQSCDPIDFRHDRQHAVQILASRFGILAILFIVCAIIVRLT